MKGKTMDRKRGIITVGFIALYMLLSCHSGDPNRQKETIKNGALKTTPQAKEQGDADEQYRLGQMYDEGAEGIERDKTLAVKWYRLAAKAGHAEAQYRLGKKHDYGAGGVVADNREAVKWYTLPTRSNE